LKRLAELLTPLGERPAFVVLVGLVSFALVFIQAWYTPFTDDPTIDSYSYFYGAMALAQGENPYDTAVLQRLAPDELGFVFPYLYPPVLALMWRPLLPLGPQGAHAVVVGVSMLLTILNAFLLWGLIRPSRHAGGWLIIFLLGLTVCGPLISSLRLGQVNVLLGTLVFGALVLERRDRSVGAGLLLALAVLIKITPLVFIIDFVVRGRWRSLLATLVFLAGLVGASALILGVEVWSAFARRVLEPLPFNPPISIRGLVEGVGSALGLPTMVTVSLVFLLVVALLARVARRLPQLGAAVPSWGLLVLFSLLAFPLTWHHHYYLALLPYGYFTIRAVEEQPTWRGWLWVALAAAALLRYPGVLHPIKPVVTYIAAFLV